MDTYSRALTGSRSRASGEYLDAMIIQLQSASKILQESEEIEI